MFTLVTYACFSKFTETKPLRMCACTYLMPVATNRPDIASTDKSHNHTLLIDMMLLVLVIVIVIALKEAEKSSMYYCKMKCIECGAHL